jgi:hypothetical protein
VSDTDITVFWDMPTYIVVYGLQRYGSVLCLLKVEERNTSERSVRDGIPHTVIIFIIIIGSRSRSSSSCNITIENIALKEKRGNTKCTMSFKMNIRSLRTPF